MNATDLLTKLGESLGSTATVRSVFGEPVHAQDKTIVPVAKVAWGFGAGGGNAPGKHDHGTGEMREGGGGGGGVRAFPAGVLEITRTRTRFIPFHDFRLVIAAFATGLVVGGLRRRRH